MLPQLCLLSYLLWPRTLRWGYLSSDLSEVRWTEKASFQTPWFCKHHPFSITFHNCKDRFPPLPSSTKHLPLKINYVLKLVSHKTLKSWPFKAIAAFVVVQCAIHNELYCEGHDKWIFPVSFVAVFEMLKYLKGPESTPGKEGKGSSVLPNIVLDHTDSHAVRDVGWA